MKGFETLCNPSKCFQHVCFSWLDMWGNLCNVYVLLLRSRLIYCLVMCMIWTSKYFLQLILELGSYIEELSKTGGAIKEFVNPKYFSCPCFWNYVIVCISFSGKLLLVFLSIVSEITYWIYLFIYLLEKDPGKFSETVFVFLSSGIS